MQPRYYFDHNATTPLSGEVMQALVPALQEVYGNASSIHQCGQAARQKLEAARRQVAAMLGASPNEMVFLSGGTEADNLAMFGIARPGSHVITTAIEHAAVLGAARRLEQLGVSVSYLKPSRAGFVSPQDVREALRPETALVSVMHANNETGVVQPIAGIAAVCREAGVLLHCDGVQAAGRIAVNVRALGVDLYSISAHKMYAPKGIGALYVRAGVRIEPQILGGRHERERRAGTENVPSAVAFGRAAEWVCGHVGEEAVRLAALRDRLERGIVSSVSDTRVNGANAERTPNTSNICFTGVEGEAMVIALDLRGFAVSSGSACSSGAVEPSHVLLAMGLSPQEARSSVRFSLGRGNDEAQVDALIEAVAAAAGHLRRVSTYSHA